MKKILLVLVISTFALGGCARSENSISSDQLFQGYPCRDNCENFKAGFESAKAQQMKEETSCTSLPEPSRVGCLAYLHEYNLEFGQPLGYVFPAKR